MGLAVWILIPFVLVSLLNGFLLSVVNAGDTAGSASVASSIEHSIAPYDGSKSGLVTLWFDDSWKSQYWEGYRLVSQAGYTGVLGVPTQYIGYPAYMSWEQVVDLQNNGWEIASHSRVHNCEIENQSYEQLRNDIEGSKNDLAEHNLSNDIYVIPCGVYDDRLLDLVRENYIGARSTIVGTTAVPVADPYLINAQTLRVETSLTEVASWIKEAEESKGWLNLMFHAITDEPGPQFDEYSVSPEFLQKVLEQLQNSELEAVLPSQVLDITTEQWQEE